ncbi:MAG: hypothetical protein GY749_38015 [Desulfobacteraceae bacterium]|nr:hypothetical protein [Desulfobacteraceae bacterium]
MEQTELDFFADKEKPDIDDLPAKRRFTGDPFVDIGGLVMKTIPGKTVEDKIRFATDVYVNKWKGKLHSIFLHSKITHISLTNKPDLQRSGTLEYYLGILQGKGAVSEGYCRVCSGKGLLFEGERKNYPMVGSGEFANYHHCQESGLLICKNCLIKLYFIPLGILQCGGSLMLLQIQNEYAEKLWQEDIILNNYDKISRGSSESILKSSYTNPQNALFYYASRLIERFELYDRPSQKIRLFYFTNFGSKPDVEIHDLPNIIFSFLKRVLKPDLKQDWLYFVKRHYRFRKSVHFDEQAGEWTEIKKKTETKLDINDYSGANHNTIYILLLSGKSILGPLFKMYKSRKFPILIAITYLRKVRKMKQEQIDLIRKISEKVIALSQKEGNYNKYITKLEGAKYSYIFRSEILRMAKAYYKNGETEPFVRCREYVEYLFPDGQNWYETRDFLLICLYEKLHDLNIEPDQISDETISDIEETGSLPIENFNQNQ